MHFYNNIKNGNTSLEKIEKYQKQFKSKLNQNSNYFEYVFKKHGENIDNPSRRIYINKIENRITL